MKLNVYYCLAGWILFIWAIGCVFGNQPVDKVVTVLALLAVITAQLVRGGRGQT